jgi:hypothetical protein
MECSELVVVETVAFIGDQNEAVATSTLVRETRKGPKGGDKPQGRVKTVRACGSFASLPSNDFSCRSPIGATIGSMSVDAGKPPTTDTAEQSVISITSARPRSANGRFMRVLPSTHGEAGPDGLPEDRFLDREISWLQFNERVLQLASDPQLPLLERARYLAIFASNLDEFFMVRVAGLKRRIATGIAVRSASGLEPREVLEQITLVSQELMAMHATVFEEDVRPALVDEGIVIVRWDQLAEVEQETLHGMFRESVFPVLTPLAVDPPPPVPQKSRGARKHARGPGKPQNRGL